MAKSGFLARRVSSFLDNWIWWALTTVVAGASIVLAKFTYFVEIFAPLSYLFVAMFAAILMMGLILGYYAVRDRIFRPAVPHGTTIDSTSSNDLSLAFATLNARADGAASGLGSVNAKLLEHEKKLRLLPFLDFAAHSLLSAWFVAYYEPRVAAFSDSIADALKYGRDGLQVKSSSQRTISDQIDDLKRAFELVGMDVEELESAVAAKIAIVQSRNKYRNLEGNDRDIWENEDQKEAWHLREAQFTGYRDAFNEYLERLRGWGRPDTSRLYVLDRDKKAATE